MHKFVWVAMTAAMGASACGDSGEASAPKASAAGESKAGPQTEVGSSSISFTGTFDAAARTIRFDARPHSAQPEDVTVPEGPGANRATLHTVSVGWDGAKGTLSGSVDVVNRFGVALEGARAVIDSVTTTGVTNDGPWSYGDVAANTTSAGQTWTFDVPGGVNFSFAGHIEVSAPCGKGSSKCIFVSSASYDGNLGGLAGADAKCQALADAALLGGTYEALLSSTTVNVKDRLTLATVPYLRMDGTQVAANGASLMGSNLSAPVSLTELSTSVPLPAYAWTYTLQGYAVDSYPGLGSYGSQWSCSDWTSNGSVAGEIGNATATSAAYPGSWQLTGGLSCTLSERLFCVEQ